MRAKMEHETVNGRTWNQACHEQVTTMFAMQPNFDTEGVTPDRLYDLEEWLELAVWALDEYEERQQAMTTLDPLEIAAVIIAKQRDYGNANLLRFGAQGIRIRLFDKVARYLNLADGKVSMNESISDTLIDIIGYITLLFMCFDEELELPLEPMEPTVTRFTSEVFNTPAGGWIGGPDYFDPDPGYVPSSRGLS